MLKNIIANIVGRFWSILSNYLFIPFYMSMLGMEAYSVISFSLILIGVMSVMAASLTATLSREFAKQDNQNNRIRTLNTLESVYWAVAIAFSVIIIFSSKLIVTRWITLSTLDVDYVSNALRVFGICIALQLLGNFYLGGLIGLQKQVQANKYQIIWGIFKNGIVLLVIYFKPSLVYFFTWQLLVTLIYVFWLRYKLVDSIDDKVEKKFVFDKTLLRNVGRFAGGMLLISIVAAVNTQLDKIAISKFLPISELGFYNIAISLSQVLVVIVSPISVALLPHFTALYSVKKTEDASELFESVFLVVSVLVFVLGAILMFFSTDLIYVWTNNKTVALSSSNYILYSTLGTAMLAMQVVPFDIVIANGHTRINNVIGILSLFISVPAYWLSVSIYGPKGAAITWCIIQSVTTPIFLYFVVKKFLKEISFMKLLMRRLVYPAAIAISTAYGLSLVFMDHFQGKLFTLLQISLATLITFAVVILISVPFAKIKQILLMLKRKKEL